MTTNTLPNTWRQQDTERFSLWLVAAFVLVIVGRIGWWGWMTFSGYLPSFSDQLLLFLSMTFRGLGLGLIFSIPLGILLSRFPRVASPLMSVLALLQTIPGLAFLGFCISILGITGVIAAVTAAVIYSVFPIVLNTYTGIIQVDPRLKDAARGMGMTDLEVLWQVELPLSLPVIMAGVRTGAVYAIGMITVCALVGAGGLGEYITRGMSRGDVALTLLGVIPILFITLFIFLGLGGIGQVSKTNPNLGLRLGGRLILALALFAVVEPLGQALTRVGGAETVQAAKGPSDAVLASANVLASSVSGLPWDTAAMILVAHSEIKSGTSQTFWEAWQRSPHIWTETARFVSLVARGLGIALLIGIPIGVLLTRKAKIAQPLITSLALVQTIPSLALLGFCVSLFPLFGPSAAIFATVVYTLFPLVLNTFTGIAQVDPRMKDAARGMGMTSLQILFRVEIPLALPVIMAGVRTAAIYAIMMVTICSLVGAKGLGDFILDGMAKGEQMIILLGVIPILCLSFLVFWSLSGLSLLSKKRFALGQVVSGSVIGALVLFAAVEPWLVKRPDIRLASKNFVENQILAEMMKIMIEEHSDPKLTVEHFPNLGSNFAYKSMLSGQLDAYPEYTGTLYFAEDALNRSEVPKDRSLIESTVRKEMKEKFNLVLLEPVGLDNSYAVAVSKETASKYGLEDIGDLQEHPLFRVDVPQEFTDREDGWFGMVKLYNLKFEFPPRLFAPAMMYEEIRKGKVQVVVGFATDWQMDTYGLEVLEDNKNYFPEYKAAPLIRAETLQKHPQVEEILNRLAGKVNNETMRRLNREVINNKRSASTVAREFLRQKGLIPK